MLSANFSLNWEPRLNYNVTENSGNGTAFLLATNRNATGARKMSNWAPSVINIGLDVMRWLSGFVEKSAELCEFVYMESCIFPNLHGMPTTSWRHFMDCSENNTRKPTD